MAFDYHAATLLAHRITRTPNWPGHDPDVADWQLLAAAPDLLDAYVRDSEASAAQLADVGERLDELGGQLSEVIGGLDDAAGMVEPTVDALLAAVKAAAAELNKALVACNAASAACEFN